MGKFEELTEKLREIFQIDRPDLDFGIYRIIGARRAEIDDFLTNRLKARVQAALARGAAADQADARIELEKLTATLSAAGVDPDTSPKVKELKAQLAAADTSARENAVFSHLLTFFSRYWDKGDFISQRRYKGDTYAIPYSGEEVVLHWANKDQYYTKSGELFANYGFTLGTGPMAGRRVLFRLVAADTAKDNRKSAEKNWGYSLATARTVRSLDEDGETIETEIVPVAVEGEELVIRFDYGPQPKGVKQADLMAAAASAVLADPAAAEWVESLRQPAPTEANKGRTLIDKHLADYATKNTADYFIHKDLGGFLGRELDFYIKSEVMRLDDIQEAQAFDDIAANLRMIQCLREVALDIITFLAGIEDFQKKLWLKRKFVVSAHWCVTLDRVPMLHERIAANPRQWQAWRELGVWEGTDGTAADLAKRPFMMVDTSLFDAAFRADLLKALPALDESTNGITIHGDNFQGLGLLSERYMEQVRCIYIDPPYNTDSSAILYKNGYKSSSWSTLIENRIGNCKNLLKQEGVIIAAIDDGQFRELSFILEGIFQNFLGNFCVRSNPSGRPTRTGYSASHEYMIAFGASGTASIGRLPPTIEQRSRFNQVDNRGPFEWRNLRREGSDSNREDRPTMYYPIYISGKDYRIPEMEWDVGTETWINVEPPRDNEIIVFPDNDNGEQKRWRWEAETVKSRSDDVSVRPDRSGKPYIYVKRRPNEAGVVSVSTWADAKHSATEHGTAVVKSLFNESAFPFPKSIYTVQDAIYVSGAKDESSITLDFFAGSGTTGHAVISLNRIYGGGRKYVLVEQGEYFDKVLKRRIQKIVYSEEWSAGKPTAPETGISHAFKVLKIESYEDALNNLSLARTPAQELALEALSAEAQDAYRMRYMLDVESRGSLLNVSHFRKPLDYMLEIATDSAGASEPMAVDLIETFNYLLGLTVDAIDINRDRGFATVTGWEPGAAHTPESRTLIIWRDCDVVDDEGLHALTRRLAINPGDAEFARVFVNGDHSLPSVIESDEGGEKTITLLPIEPEFLTRMWDVKDV